MKTKSLKLFIKQKKMEIERLSARIAPLKLEIEELQKRIRHNEEQIQALEERPAQRLFDLALSHSHIGDLRSQNEKILAKMERLQNEISALQKELSELFGQKKGLEKLLERTIHQQEKKANEEENRLADESYLRKIHAS